MNFFKDDTRNLSSELHETFCALNSVDSSSANLAKHLSLKIQKYVAEKMLPKLLQLEMIILLNAYILKGKPICDLFYCFDTESKQRIVRDTKDDFYNLVAGEFMVLYYKVCNSSTLTPKYSNCL